MAGNAAQFLKKLFAIRGHGTLRLAASQPGFKIFRLHDHYLANHAGVLGAAILGAKQVVGARLRGLKPDSRIAIGKHVIFHPEGGDEKAVDHILGNHGNLDRPSRGNVKRVDLTLPSGALKFPHPLLANTIEFKRVGWGASLVEINSGAPGKNEHRDAQWYDRPDDLQQG